MNRFSKFGLIFLLGSLLLVSLSGCSSAEGRWILADQGCKVWNGNPKANKTVTWSGGKDDNGCATGPGILQWYRNGKTTYKYEGTMLNGKMNGKGIYINANGDRYEGDFVDNQKHGRGVLTWADGDRYEGDFVDDKSTGKGIFTWADGDRYEGDFVDGEMHGNGVFYSRDGSVKEGRWSNDKYVGQ